MPERLHSDGMDLGAMAHRRDDDNSWLEHLFPANRARALALRDTAMEYLRLGLQRPATRKAWLAAADEAPKQPPRTGKAEDETKSTTMLMTEQKPQAGAAGADAGEAPGKTRAAKHERITTAYRVYMSLHRDGKLAQQQHQQQLQEQQGQGQPRPREGAQQAAPRPPWPWEEYLLPHQRAHVATVRELYYEFKELRLANAARRDMWLAEDGDEGRPARLEHYKQLHAAYLERHRLYQIAVARRRRQQQQQQQGPAVRKTASAATDAAWMQHLTASERKQAEEAHRALAEYKRLGLTRKKAHDAWLVEDQPLLRSGAINLRLCCAESRTIDASLRGRSIGKPRKRPKQAL